MHHQVDLLLTQESVDATRGRHVLVAEIGVKHLKKYCQWKQPKCPLTDEWIKKIRYISTMEYYSAIKRNEIMPFAATWMDLEIIILSEVSQTEKDKYHMISLICGL